MVSGNLFRTLLLGLLIAVSMPGTAKSKTVIVVGIEDFKNYPNTLYYRKNGTLAGFSKSLFDAFAEQYDYEIIYRSLPIKRLYYELTTGKVDLKFPDDNTWGKAFKQNYDVIYSKPVVDYMDGFFTTKEGIHSMDDINSIAYVRGFSPEILASSKTLRNVTVIETRELDDAIALTLNNRVDAFYANIQDGYWLLKNRFHANQLVYNESLPHNKSSYSASTVHNPEVLDDFNQFLDQNQPLILTLKEHYAKEH